MSEFPSPGQQQPAAIPPGWYFDGAQQRWWDGLQWGPVAPQGGVDSSDRTFATLSHLGSLLGGFILPLVMYLISDDERRPETRYHAREGLNFQITVMIVYVLAGIGFVLSLVAGAGFTASDPDNPVAPGFFIGFFLAWGIYVLVAVGSLVLSIIAAVRANKGIRYRYPVCLRFVKG